MPLWESNGPVKHGDNAQSFAEIHIWITIYFLRQGHLYGEITVMCMDFRYHMKNEECVAVSIELYKNNVTV